jgi:HK97 family phage portal protein
MKLPFSNFFGRKQEVKSTVRTLTIPAQSFLGFALLGGGHISAHKAMQFYRQNSSVATAVDMIATAFEQIQPVLKAPDGKLTNDHDVIKLLNQPNGFQSWREFGGMLSRHYLLKHDTHITGLGSVKRPPLEVYSVKPQVVSNIEDSRDQYPSRYFVQSGSGKGIYNRAESLKTGARFYDGTLKELFHIMGFSSLNTNLQGDSPLQAIALEIKQQLQGRVHNLKMIENGGRLSLIVSFKDPDGINPDEHERRKKRINEDLSGAENAGGIAVISAAETSVKEVGNSNKDMDYVKLDETAGNIIFLRYGIPLPLVSTKATTFNNMQTAIGIFYDQAVIPNSNTIFGGLSKFLLPRYGLDPAQWSITYDPLSITALQSRMLDEIEKRKKNNLETTNELRALIGREEITEGGDIVYQPANLVPVGTDLLTEDDNLTADDHIDNMVDPDE